MVQKYQNKEAENARSFYASIMEEIKRRNKAISDMLGGTLPPQPKIIAYEFCNLQLRLICELIITACAVAHVDIQEIRGKKFQKLWHAGDMSKSLEQLHPEFYPKASRQIIGVNGKVLKVEPLNTDEYLTLKELRNLYAQCGNVLHIGNLKNLTKKSRPIIHMDKVGIWNQKIIKLLNHHQIQLFDPEFQLWTVMNGKDDGKVHVNLFMRQEAKSSTDQNDLKS